MPTTPTTPTDPDFMDYPWLKDDESFSYWCEVHHLQTWHPEVQELYIDTPINRQGDRCNPSATGLAALPNDALDYDPSTCPICDSRHSCACDLNSIEPYPFQEEDR